MNNSAFAKIITVSAVLSLAVICLFPLTTGSTAHAKEPAYIQLEIPADEGMFVVGEELVYVVSYSIFDLGEVKLQITDTTTKMGTKVFVAKAFVDSYSGVPFVNLHQVFYSEMSKVPFSVYFTVHNTAKPEAMQYVQYAFDYAKNTMRYEVGLRPQNVIEKRGEESVADFQQDGLSLFYYARANVRSVKKVKTPVFINEKSFLTDFNFMGKIGSQKIDAVKYPVRTIEFDGTANFIGIFGLTGYFQGYFSDDAASVPIVAKMKVLVGSIHIELTKWSRPGWTPPRATS